MTSADFAMLALAAVACVLLILIFVVTSGRRLGVARKILWLGVLAPILSTTQRTVLEAQQAGIGPPEAVRGGLPILCLAVAWVLVRPRSRPLGLVEIALLGFLALALISSSWSEDARLTALRAVLLAGPYLCLLLLVRCYESIEDGLEGLASFVHLLLMAAILNFLIAPETNYEVAQYEAAPRLSMAFPQVAENILAWLAGVGLLLLLLNIGPSLSRRLAIRLVLMPTYVVILVATRTRIALLVFTLLLVGVAVALARRKPLLTTAAVTSIGIAVYVLAGLTDQVKSFFERGQDARGLETLTGRTVGWEQAFDLWKDRPLLGYGYYAAHRVTLPRVAGGLDVSNLDNVWLETLLGTGVVGLVLLVVFVLAAWWRLEAHKAAMSKDHLIFMRAVIISIIIVSFVNPTLQVNVVTMMVGGFVLLLMPRSGPALSRPRDPTSVLAASISRAPLRTG